MNMRAAGWGMLAGLAWGAGQVSAADGVSAVVTSTGSDIVYEPPPQISAPGFVRTSGGTRGGADPARAGAEVRVEVLAPEHLGRTARDQPTVYWYLSEHVSAPVDIVLSVPGEDQPMLELNVTTPVDAGIRALPLAEHGVRLRPGLRYKLTVSVLAPGGGPDSTSAAGFIEHVPSSRTPAGSGAVAARTLAARGYWYDALDLLSVAVRQGGDGAAVARQDRAALLAQVHLGHVAAPPPAVEATR